MSSRGSGYAYIVRISLVLTFLAMLLGLDTGVLANPQQGTPRTIVSDDFTRNRQETPSAGSKGKVPKGKTPSVTASKPKRGRTYRLASKPKTHRRPSSPGTVVAQLGITIWRLRFVEGNVTGARVLVREKGKKSEWVPERVPADTIFREGDRVRLTIESPRKGYLYVVDRELYSNGSTGVAKLIYPWADMRGGDNLMAPGKLIDIPAQEEDRSYFTAERSRADQVGELLTVIITTSRLNLPISDEPIEISKDDLAQWEKMWGGESDRFEMKGGAGETWSIQEQQAAASKGTRQLTRDDPAPQTIYRLSGANNKGILVNVRLRYGK